MLTCGWGILESNRRWRPDTEFEGAPITISFDYEDERVLSYLKHTKSSIVYYGYRPHDSLSMHEFFAHGESYPYHFPSKSAYMLINLSRNCRAKSSRALGMVDNRSDCVFDSCFESGNLDLAVRVKENEYDLYMKADSNTKGHHQWFYFSVQSKKAGTVRFNIVNFTKKKSLYTQGMRVTVFSEQKANRTKDQLFKGWHKAGSNIAYGLSKVNQESRQRAKSK